MKTGEPTGRSDASETRLPGLLYDDRRYYLGVPIMDRPSRHDPLPSDPFAAISESTPAHIRMRRRRIGLRSVLLLLIGFGFLGAAWWLYLR